jgi:UDP-glucose 4-epimerase
MQTSAFDGAEVLITGGLGFIGSTLALRLLELGARVTVVDALIPDYGGNLFNVETVKDRIRINVSDIRDRHGMNHLVQGKDYVFHLASQVSHIRSMTVDPFDDIDINIKGTAILLEACKAHNRRAVVVRAGTRGQYGPASALPVSEDAPMNPRGIYEISQLTAEKILQVYGEHFGIRAVNLRLTNVYGPRAQMRHSHFGVANWFIRLALDDQTIELFGDGAIKRDFLYVDDCVEALLASASCPGAHGGIFNVGFGTPTTFKEFAERLIRIAGTGRWRFAPFSPERAAQEPGDFYSDISRIATIVGWKPRTSLDDGLERSVAFYRRWKEHYW